MSEGPVEIALEAIAAAGCHCDDDSDGIGAPDRDLGEHECLAGKCEHAIVTLREELRAVLEDWNALRDAIGSPTNGGAVGHASCLRAAHARLREALCVIRDAGGKTTEEGLSCNGRWCAEQARRAVADDDQEG